MTASASGACLCGTVTFELRFPSNWVAHCHCSMCRRAHGAAFVTWISVPRDQFHVTSGEDALVHYASSPDSTRTFCRTCGSTLLFESARWAGEIHVARASIPGPVDRQPQVHAFFSDRAAWVDIHDELPRRGGKTGVEPLADDALALPRPIEGFAQDEHGDWVAMLGCGHRQHVRHKPPLSSRPWVLTEDGRRAKLGLPVPCPLCARFELPAGHTPYKRTAEFTESSIPDGLRRDHSTRPGVWGIVHVLEGRLRYIVEPPLAREQSIEAGHCGVIVPEVRHRVEPDGAVRFFVEFHRRST